MPLNHRYKKIMFQLLSQGAQSRTALVENLGVRRNTLYDDVAEMIKHRLISETEPHPASVGRPRTPLRIDDVSRNVLGVSFQPGRVEVTRSRLLGSIEDRTWGRNTTPGSAVRIAAELVQRHRTENTLAIGVSIPGFIDREAMTVVFSVAFPHAKSVSLGPIRQAAPDLPIVIETEAHAVTARWMLAHACEPLDDTLLIYFDDGSLGAAFLVHGRPNRGCISGANELGHTRLPVETEVCYCGQVGCLERLCDTKDLARHGLNMPLQTALIHDAIDHPAIQRMTKFMSMGFANAVNFTRAKRVVIASQLIESRSLIAELIGATRQQLLPQLRSRVQFDAWPEAETRSAGTSSYLGLMEVFYETWDL